MSQPPKKKKVAIRLEDVTYYFDGVERDRIDAAGMSRKTGELLALRDRLLRLPELQFDATIRTVKGLLTETKDEGETTEARRTQARQLFTETRGGAGGSLGATGKVSPA